MFGVNPRERMRRAQLDQLLAAQGGAMPAPPKAPGDPGSGFLRAEYAGAPASPMAPPMAPPAPPPAPMAPAPTNLFGGGAPTPPPSDDIAVTAQRQTLDDSPLAMTQSAQTFQAKKPTLMNQLGFLAQAFDEGPRGYTEGREAWEGRQRRQFTEQQTASSRTTAIDVVRRILSTDEDPIVRRVAQMAGTPEAFIEWYAKHDDTREDRSRTDRQLTQGDRGLDQNDVRLKQGDRQIDAGIDSDRRQNSLGWYNAQTNRQVAEASAPGKDPLERGMIANDVDQVQQFSDAASQLGGLVPSLNAFAAANDRERGTGAGSLASWSPFVNADTSEMRSITPGLAQSLRVAGSGSMSERDMDLLLVQAPGVGKSKEANDANIARWKVAANRAVERERYAREYLRRDRSLGTFNRFWSAYINEASIADGDRRTFAQWMQEKQAAARPAAGAAR